MCRRDPGAMVTLVLESLGRTARGEVHLAGIDLRLEAGRFHVLLGPTRAGKTSLLRAIAGLDTATTGDVRLEGTDATSLRGQVAMVYQDFVNYPSLSARENIAAPLRARRVPKAEIPGRVAAAAARVGIEDLLDRRPAQLSGGQQQRLAIARALVQEARVVLLDEPLANLDFKLREDLREEVRTLFEGQGSIVLYATTDPAEALGFGGDLIVLDEGRVRQHGPGRAVYDAPADERVARITSDPPLNLWDAQVIGDELRIGAALALPLPAHLQRVAPGQCRVGLRPHHLSLSAHAGRPRIAARAELAEVDGSVTCVHAGAGDLALIAEQPGAHEVRLGQDLELFLDPRGLFAFHVEGRLLAAPTCDHGGGDHG